MSIIMISGVPGSGKSIKAVEDFLLPALKEGRDVWHNIRGVDIHRISSFLDIPYIKLKRLCHYMGEEEDQVVKGYLSKVPPNSLTILDEAHRYFSPQAYKTLGQSGIKEFISLHRHYGNDIVLMTQHIDDIWSGVKTRIEQTHYLYKNPLSTSPHKYTEKVFIGFDVNKEPLIKKNKEYNKKIFPLYQSRKVANVEERNFRANPWLQKKFIWRFALIFLVLAFVIYRISTNGLIPSKTNKTEKKQKTTTSKIVKKSDKDAKKNILEKIQEAQSPVLIYVSFSCNGNMCKVVSPEGQITLIPKIFFEDEKNMPIRLVSYYEKSTFKK